MNWVFAVVSGLALLSTINWLLNSQYHFKGPKRVQFAVVIVENGPADDANNSSSAAIVTSADDEERGEAQLPLADLVKVSDE